MKNKNIKAIRDATAQAFARQARNALFVAKQKGYTFPAECDVAVKINEASPLSMSVSARIDDINDTFTISVDTKGEEVADMANKLVVRWLDKHATKVT